MPAQQSRYRYSSFWNVLRRLRWSGYDKGRSDPPRIAIRSPISRALGEVLSPLTPSINRDDAQARGSRPYCRHRANTSAAIFTAALASVPVSAALRSRSDFTRCRTDSDSADNSTARSACLRARAKSPPANANSAETHSIRISCRHSPPSASRRARHCASRRQPSGSLPQPRASAARPVRASQAASGSPARPPTIASARPSHVDASAWRPLWRRNDALVLADREARTRSECVENPAVSRSRTSNAARALA